MIRTIFPAAFFLALAACAPEREAAPETDRDAATPAQTIAPQEGGDRIGRLYHYVRSNVDGTRREDVHVFRKSADTIEVYRAREKCGPAALDSAVLDMEAGHMLRLAGGRLLPGGGREQFAFYSYDPSNRTLTARIEEAPGEPAMTGAAAIDREPWHLYNFDFASLTIAAPHLEPRDDFAFGLALAIPEPGRDDFLLYLGDAQATFRGEEARGGRDAHRYALGGPAFGSFGGSLWLDAADGHLVDIETAMPNHLDYHDFKLELVDIDDGGEEAWAELLAHHFEDCE